MSKKMKWAYRALRIQDMADAAMSAAPRVALDVALLVAGWLLIGGNPMFALWAMAVAGIAAAAVAAVAVLAVAARRILGYSEETLERLALA